MHPLGIRTSRSHVLLTAGIVGLVLLTAVVVALARIIGGIEATPGPWSIILVIAAAFAGFVVWRISDPVVVREDRLAYRRFAIGLGVAAVAVALAVIVADTMPIAVGGVVMMVFFAEGLTRLPGESSRASQLRSAMDGAFIGSCLLFTGWGFLGPRDVETELLTRYGEATVTGMAAVVMFGIGIVVTVRARTYRRRYILLVAALGLVAVSHVSILIATAGPLPDWACRLMVLAGALGCLAAAGTAWLARRYPGARKAQPLPRVDAAIALIPAGMAVGSALYYTIAVGSLTTDALLLGMAAVATLSIRQLLAKIDVRRYAEEAADGEKYLRSIVAGSSDFITVLDARRRVRWQAFSAEWRPGSADRDLTGVEFADLVHPDDAAEVNRQLADVLSGSRNRRHIQVDARICDADGVWRDTESTVSDQREVPQVGGLVVHTRDIGKRRSLERELAKLAYVDSLTSLSNRRALLRTLEADVAGGAMPCTLLAIDLDGFKKVNDTQGHDIGDAVLVEVARRIIDNLRPTDVAARLGGDEFAVLLWCDPLNGHPIAERLREVLAEPYQLDRQAPVYLSTSIGLAGCSTADDVEALLRNADLALRSAKQGGKNRIEAYDQEFEQRIRRRNLLEQALHGAVERNELSLVYQPVISLPDRRIVGAEALMRWNHPDFGPVSPGEFIPIVEDAGLSSMLTAWTLKEVAERLAVWRSAGHPTWISMNLSPRQLHSGQLAADCAQALLQRGVPPSKLVVEVTEQDVAQDIDMLAAQLGTLRGTGVRVALDDFGAGYSSLGQLHRLPVDILKIDRNLVAGDDRGSAPLADVVVRLGERLGLSVIAEGVESQLQLDVVENAGCRMVQGYLLFRPLSVNDIDRLLEQEATIVRTSQLAIES
ncbi:MAG TPA: EAL domain-containing protein [Candidatus Stackebrandtia excrementipullorum]|nr:EAL domain-containing protein [Candidatus Stackebrandtia excrementipullorum]